MLGSLTVFLVSSLISRSDSVVERSLIRIGGYSQEVYEVHPMMFYLVPIAVVLLGGTASTYSSLYTLLWPARLVLGVAVSLLVVEYVISRHRFTRLVFRGNSSPRFQ
jgi:hypothetical protein